MVILRLAGHADIPGDVFRNPERLQSGGNPGADAYLAVGRHAHGAVDGHSEHYGPARNEQGFPVAAPATIVATLAMAPKITPTQLKIF